MKRQWQTMSYKDHSGGMDTRSSPDNIPDTFCKDLVDVDVKPTGELKKRKGYEGFAGNIPMRVTKVQLETIDSVKYHHFQLDGSMDFSTLTTTPLVVYGHLSGSQAGGDFTTTDSSAYYPSCLIGYNLRRPITGGLAVNSVEYTVTDSGVDSALLWSNVGFSTDTVPTSTSYELIQADSLTINLLTLAFTNDIYSLTDESAFVFWKDCSDDYVDDTWEVAETSTTAVTISASEHGQSTFNLQVKFFRVSGPDYIEVFPDSLVLDDGDITASFINTGAAFDIRVIVSSVPAAQTTELEVATGTNSTSISVTSPWVFTTVYKRMPDDTLEQIFPTAIEYDSTTGEYDIQIESVDIDTWTAVIYYQYGTAAVNVISVEVNNTAAIIPYTDSAPILTLWGIDHSYYLSGSEGGKVTFLTNYETEAVTELIAGLGGNLFYAADRAVEYKIPVVKTALDDTLLNSVTVGPAFGTSARDRSTVTATEVVSGYLPITSASYENGLTVYTTPVLTSLLVGGVAADLSSLQDAISLVKGAEDWLTVANMNSSKLNGTFKIVGLESDGSSISFSVVNPNMTSSDYNQTNAAGKCGVFTDQIQMVGNIFMAGDIVNNTAIQYPILGTSVINAMWAGATLNALVVLSNVTADKEFLKGQRLSVTRTSSTLIPRATTAVGEGSIKNEWMVKNDVVFVEGNENGYSIKSLNPYTTSSPAPTAVLLQDSYGLRLESESLDLFEFVAAGDTVHISLSEDQELTGNFEIDTKSSAKIVYVEDVGDLLYGQVTFDTGENTVGIQAHGLVTGDTVHFVALTDATPPFAVYESGSTTYADARMYVRVVDSDNFSIYSNLDDAISDMSAVSVTGTTGTYLVHQQVNVLVNEGTITLREEIELEDKNGGSLIDVEKRWLPIEPPDTDSVFQFDNSAYDSQPFMSGSMMHDNLYVTNGVDEVMKYDGLNLHRAGLFRWQSGLSLSVDYANPTIARSSSPVAVTGVSGSTFSVDSGNELEFLSGDVVWFTSDNVADSAKYIVDRTEDTKVYVTSTISLSGGATADELVRMDRRKYYMRLSGFDSNGNIIASDITGADDFVVDTYDSHTVIIKLLAVPKIGDYDFSRVELSLYRTASDSSTFYKLATRQIDTASEGQVIIYDRISDARLGVEKDEVSIVQEGGNLLVGFTQPLRAKAVATIDSRMVYANLKDYPELDMTVRATDKDGVILTTDKFAGKTLTFRKDNTDTATATDLDKTFVYEFIATGEALAISSIAAASGTITFTTAGHTLVNGDWIYLYQSVYAESVSNVLSGLFQVTGVAGNDFDIKFVDHGLPDGAVAVATNVNSYAKATISGNIPVFLGTNYCLQQNGSNDASVTNLVVTRLAAAINTSMVASSVLTPWMTANADSNYGLGQIVIRIPLALTTVPEVEMSAGDASYQWYISGIARSSTEAFSAGSQERLFPSRVSWSRQNYPELFDRPYAAVASDSSGVADINPADGQEIVQISPLFADAVYGSGTKEGLVVVLKERSLYVLSLATGQYTKIESEGLGCDAPRSVKAAKNGVMFANRAGIYRIAKDLSVQYIGRNIEGTWNKETNKTKLSEQTAYQSPIDHRYLLSVSRDAEAQNNHVYAYEYSKESEGVIGAWSRYRNFNTTYWAGLTGEGYYGTYSGNVYKLKNTNTASDFADDGEAIESIMELGAKHFGAPNDRKLIAHVYSSFDSTVDMGNTVVSISTDMGNDFISTTPISITDSDREVEIVKSSSPVRKAVLFQVKVVNSTIYEPVTLSGIGYEVSLLSGKTVKEAVDSR